LLDKLLLLLASLRLPEPVLLVADAYYASGKIIRGLFTQGGHLVSRFRLNACAFEPVPAPSGRRGRLRLMSHRFRWVFSSLADRKNRPGGIFLAGLTGGPRSRCRDGL